MRHCFEGCLAETSLAVRACTASRWKPRRGPGGGTVLPPAGGLDVALGGPVPPAAPLGSAGGSCEEGGCVSCHLNKGFVLLLNLKTFPPKRNSSEETPVVTVLFHLLRASVTNRRCNRWELGEMCFIMYCALAHLLPRRGDGETESCLMRQRCPRGQSDRGPFSEGHALTRRPALPLET